MTDHLISLKRTPDAIVAIVSHCVHDYWEVLYEDNLVNFLELYEFREQALKELSPSLYKKKKRLLVSWKYLSSVEKWDAELLFHVLVVILETIPVLKSKNRPLPILEIETQVSVPQKTAAHPRGFLGKKGKTQKPSRPSRINLQPYLNDPKNIPVVLNKLKIFRKQTIKKLKVKGYEIPSSLFDMIFETPYGPYFLFHYSEAPKKINTQIPNLFNELVLPSLKTLSWKKIRKFLAIFYQLNLESDATLISAYGRFLKLCPQTTVLIWNEILLELPIGKRFSFLVTLIETESWNILETYTPKIILQLCEKIPYVCLENRLKDMFQALQGKVDAEYLLAGFSLSNKYNVHYSFHNLGNFVPFFKKKFYRSMSSEKVLKHLTPWQIMMIWKRFSQLPNLDKFLVQIPINLLNKETLEEFFDLYLNWDNNKNKFTGNEMEKWNFLLHQTKNIVNRLQSLDPIYHKKYLITLTIFINYYWFTIRELKRYLPRLNLLFVRICARPQTKYFVVANIYCDFIEYTSDKSFKKLLECPDSSYSSLEKTCSNRNRYTLIQRAIQNLIKTLPDFTVDCFVKFPNKLIKTLTKLGTLRIANRKKLLHSLKNHQLFKLQVERISCDNLYKVVTKYRTEKMFQPTPKKLKLFFQGELDLSPKRLQAYTAKFKYNYESFLLDFLNEKINLALSKDFIISSKQNTKEHTLQFLSLVKKNRRPLKNYLKAFFSGNEKYIDTHPLTQKWMQRNSKLAWELWKRGILFCRQSTKWGPVNIQIERDPEEILKMGTYVGTCLSLGGDYMYSAIAALLDINKQVLYARDANQKVLGRQLVAISKNKELVCFTVYPENSSPEIKNMFLEYDLYFSEALGIPLYENSDEDGYEIELILANDWWDDWIWEKVAYF